MMYVIYVTGFLTGHINCWLLIGRSTMIPTFSAIKGVNQAFARFTPFFTPKNAIRTKLGSGNIPFIGYFVITTLIQTKYPQKISTNNYNKN